VRYRLSLIIYCLERQAASVASATSGLDFAEVVNPGTLDVAPIFNPSSKETCLAALSV